MAAAKPKTEDKVDPSTGEVLEEGKSSGQVATQTQGGLPAEYDYGEDAGAGFDNQTSEDIAIPFLEVLQPGSPEVQGEDAKGKSGMIINKSTGEVYSGRDGITFIPAYTQHLLVEWVPRDNGGGLVGQHAIDSDLAKKVRAEQPLGTYKHPDNGNDLVETFYVYGVLVDENGSPLPAVIAMSSTKIKPYKDWQFKIRSIVIPLDNGAKLTSAKLPLWAFAWKLATVFVEKNGYKWYNWTTAFAGTNAKDSMVKPGTELYLAAKSVYEGIRTGAVRAATETLRREDAVDETPRQGDKSAAAAPY